MESSETAFIALIGIVTTVLGVLGFVVKYFVSASTRKDEIIYELTNKFIKTTEDTNKSHSELTQAIDTNTKATRESSESSKRSSDNLTKLVLKIVKSNK